MVFEKHSDVRLELEVQFWINCNIILSTVELFEQTKCIVFEAAVENIIF